MCLEIEEFIMEELIWVMENRKLDLVVFVGLVEVVDVCIILLYIEEIMVFINMGNCVVVL